jgi:choline dehydrogenase-like flavoprotein
MSTSARYADLLVVGSGPVGATLARVVRDELPEARIVMVEAGPQVASRPGMHLHNLADPEARARAQRRCEGPASAPAEVHGTPEDPLRKGLAEPGTFLVESESVPPADGGMPAAVMSCNAGGMAAHWTCACPRPDESERTGLLPAREWSAALARAEALLGVTTTAFEATETTAEILETLRSAYGRLPADRGVQPMPLACTVRDGARYWTGPDVVLEPLLEGPDERFRLLTETVCRRLHVEDGRVTAAVVGDLRTHTEHVIRATCVAVAADSFRTPQLLWASGIRPRALGHYLNDHIQILAGVPWPRGAQRSDEADDALAHFWIPYSPEHPFHGQVMQFGVTPNVAAWTPERREAATVLGFGWLAPKEIRYEDCVTFADSTDAYGMPRPRIEYRLTPHDHEVIAAGIEDVRRAAEAFGTGFTDDNPPHVLPAGSSCHYQGTVRAGAADDGTSVCDPYCRVWGTENLFVGGNGVIDALTATNPTLTSVALATRAASRIASLLRTGAAADDASVADGAALHA